MEEVRHADATLAESRRAPQARTTKEIDSSARLSQMSAQLLCKNRIGPPRSADGSRAVVLARRIERICSGKAWCGHTTTPDSTFPGEAMLREGIWLARPGECVAASCAGLRTRAGRPRTIREGALTGLPHAWPAHRRFRTATLGWTIAKGREVATRVRTAGRAGPRTAGGLSWIRDARTAEMMTIRWWTRTIAKLSGCVGALALPAATDAPVCRPNLSNCQQSRMRARLIQCRFGTKCQQAHCDTSHHFIYRSTCSPTVVSRELRHQERKLFGHTHAHEKLLGKIGVAVGDCEDHLHNPSRTAQW
jgi:hypothetical protein